VQFFKHTVHNNLSYHLTAAVATSTSQHNITAVYLRPPQQW